MPQNEYLKNQLLKKFIASALPVLKPRKPSIRNTIERRISESAPEPKIEELEQTTINLVRPCGGQYRQRARGIRGSR